MEDNIVENTQAEQKIEIIMQKKKKVCLRKLWIITGIHIIGIPEGGVR